MPDTDPDTETRLLELFRAAGETRRLELMFGFSNDVIALARAAYRRAEPTLDNQEAGLRFVAEHYGAELAENLRVRLRASR